MTGYYDYVLGLVPVTLVGITAVLAAVGVGYLTAVSVGAAAAALVVGHAMFVNGPVAPEESGSVRSASDHGPVNAD
ncbi:hypothetical protein [Haloplanus halophilus]|uniref:hypothetical protein n=1 Tax=Haloplanus halophilus TaxID=2949993 RepID=UPI003CCCA2E6